MTRRMRRREDGVRGEAATSNVEDKNAPAPVRVMTSIEFLSGSAKAFETPLVQATAENVPDREAIAFQFDVPLDGLKPGTYVCQINVIDDAGGRSRSRARRY